MSARVSDVFQVVSSLYNVPIRCHGSEVSYIHGRFNQCSRFRCSFADASQEIQFASDLNL